MSAEQPQFHIDGIGFVRGTRAPLIRHSREHTGSNRPNHLWINDHIYRLLYCESARHTCFICLYNGNHNTQRDDILRIRILSLQYNIGTARIWCAFQTYMGLTDAHARQPS